MTTEASRGHRGLSFVLAMLAMLAPFSIDTYLPSFPELAQALHATDVQLQQTLSVYLLGFAVMTLVYGPLSDAFGRRRVTLWSIAVFVVSTAGTVFVTDIHALIVLRGIQGLAASSGVVIGRAVIRDVYHGAHARRVMANIMLMFLAAPAFAPIIGGFLEQWWGWRSVFVFLALLGLAVLAVTYWMLPETLHREHRQSPHPVAIARGYVHALGNMPFMLLVLVVAMNFGGFFIYISGAPALLYRHLGMGTGDFGWLFVPLVSGMMLGAWLSGRSAHHIPAVTSVAIGAAVMLVAALVNTAVAATFPDGAFAAIAPVVVYAVGMSFAMPAVSVLVLDMMPHKRGLASSVQGFAQTGFNAVVAGAVVPLVHDTTLRMATGMLILNAAGLVCGALWWRHYRHQHGGAA